MLEKARGLMEFYGFKSTDANCALEAKPPVPWNKGRASIYILRTAFGVDWSERIKIIYAGDDVTDEDAMMVIFIYGIFGMIIILFYFLTGFTWCCCYIPYC